MLEVAHCPIILGLDEVRSIKMEPNKQFITYRKPGEQFVG
jgi:hypothetical protein